jgi:hypothetical protein
MAMSMPADMAVPADLSMFQPRDDLGPPKPHPDLAMPPANGNSSSSCALSRRPADGSAFILCAALMAAILIARRRR